MIQIVVFLILQHGQIITYTLPKDYGQLWACDEAVERIQANWQVKKGIGIFYRCKRFITVSK